MDISAFFIERRFDKDTHVGLGDIRLTFADQEKIIDAFRSLESERSHWKGMVKMLERQLGKKAGA